LGLSFDRENTFVNCFLSIYILDWSRFSVSVLNEYAAGWDTNPTTRRFLAGTGFAGCLGVCFDALAAWIIFSRQVMVGILRRAFPVDDVADGSGG